MSRGTWNIATSLVWGSIDATISVSVLKNESPLRWSTPTRRMFRRSLPSQGGSDGACVPVTPLAIGDGTTSGESVGAGLCDWDASAVPESPGFAGSLGSGALSAVVQLGSSVSENTQFTRSIASRL